MYGYTCVWYNYISLCVVCYRCRDRTTGVTHEVIRIREGVNADFDIYDVGGQKSERRNWVRIFQNVKAVLFVVAISEVRAARIP